MSPSEPKARAQYGELVLAFVLQSVRCTFAIAHALLQTELCPGSDPLSSIALFETLCAGWRIHSTHESSTIDNMYACAFIEQVTFIIPSRPLKVSQFLIDGHRSNQSNCTDNTSLIKLEF